MTSYAAKLSELDPKWYVIDAEDVILGRLASRIAVLLRGRHKPTFSPNLDCGDNIIVINAEKVRLTGRKLTDKSYFRHTGFPGGIKETTPQKVLNGAYPERVLEMAVERMLPKDSPLARKQFKKLYVYAGKEHPHAAQTPIAYDFASENRKNKKTD